MVTRHESQPDRLDVWARLSAPLPEGCISWRQDGRPTARSGKWFARFVAYIDAQTVRERLDLTVPGEWDLTLELLPGLAGDGGEVESDSRCSFKARLQILGVIREDVGTGKDYKQAATDAFKRAATRFGVAHELYSYEQNWVEVDGDGKFAKPLEDPAQAYARRQQRSGEQSTRPTEDRTGRQPEPTQPSATASASAPDSPASTDEPSCPKCGGRMWDNRLSKRNPKAPDMKCRSRSCDGVIWQWPPRDKNGAPVPAPWPRDPEPAASDWEPDESQAYDGEIPF